jgi:TM2 domain-containing membrane protein YozV
VNLGVPPTQPGPGQPYIPQPNYQYAPQPTQPASSSNRTAGIGSAYKDKWVAAVLAFLLGTFGIHKFYLGYKNEGLIMLLVSILGSCLAGAGALVMLVISMIEAVRYVILTQEDFERKYVFGSKGWL